MVTLSGSRNFVRFIQDTEPAVHDKGDLWLDTTSTDSITSKGLYKSTGIAWVGVFREDIPGDIGLFGGKNDGGYSNVIDQVTISSPGNATDFGDLTVANSYFAATSNGTSDTGIFGGGHDGSRLNTIDQVTISSPGNATNFGDLTVAQYLLVATSNGTNDTGIFGGGPETINTIAQVTISSPGNATDFGDLTVGRYSLSATSNGTNDTGIFGGGNIKGSSVINTIDQVTISSPGNATNFGDLTGASYGLAATSNGTSDTGIFGAGVRTHNGAAINTIDQVTISSAGNATDFGDLNGVNYNIGATSNGTNDTGIFGGGGVGGSYLNRIDQVTISSPGNATDFGDLTDVKYKPAATSNGLT